MDRARLHISNNGDMICETVESDVSSPDTISTGISVDSTCSSPYSSEANNETLSGQLINPVFKTNEEVLNGVETCAISACHEIRKEETEKPTASASQLQVVYRNRSTSRYSILDLLELEPAPPKATTRYSTQEIEQCLARTQKLFQKWERLENKQDDLGLEIWTQLKVELNDLDTYSSHPRTDVKPKYLYDVGRFKARVLACVQRYEAALQKSGERPRKKRCLSASKDHTASSTLSDEGASITSSVSSADHSEEVTSFLYRLEEEIYKSILTSLCPDNMRGSFCKTPLACSQNCFFACPEYAIHQKCTYEKDQVFSHAGYKHTVQGCTVHHRNECKARHPNGDKCRTKVIFFHVRASCMSLRGDGYICRTVPCLFGHDNPAIRRAVMNKDQ